MRPEVRPWIYRDDLDLCLGRGHVLFGGIDGHLVHWIPAFAGMTEGMLRS
jgi:hypothetical protein